MKKVINITLGSVIFAIDEDAYAALVAYLDQIKSHLATSDDANEIIDDVEIAIAEKFIAQNRSEKMAVTTVEVEAVISEMGSPSEFSTHEEATSTQAAAAVPKEAETDAKKRLYRDKDNAVVAGVAAGIANYFDIDPVIVRLIFAILVFVNGLGLLAYFIFWLIVPIAETTAQKYAMRGEQVTLRDISQRIKKNLGDIKNADYPEATGLWATFRRILDASFQILGMIVVFGISLLRYVFGIGAILIGAFGMAGLVAAYSVLLFQNNTMFGPDIAQIFDTLRGTVLGITAVVSLFVTIAIPLIVSILLGTSLLTRRSYFTIQKSVALIVLWIMASILATATIAFQVQQVVQQYGPFNGRADDSGLEVEWKNGVITIDEQSEQMIFEEKGIDATGSATRTIRYIHSN